MTFFVKGEVRVTLVFSRVNFVYSFVSFLERWKDFIRQVTHFTTFFSSFFLGSWEFLPFFHLFLQVERTETRAACVYCLGMLGICWLASGTLWDCMRFSQNFEPTTMSGVLKRSLDCVSLMIFICQPSFWRGVWIAWSVASSLHNNRKNVWLWSLMLYIFQE